MGIKVYDKGAGLEGFQTQSSGRQPYDTEGCMRNKPLTSVWNERNNRITTLVRPSYKIPIVQLC